MKYHIANPAKEIEKPLKSANMNEVVSQWDADYVDIDQELLFELILAANYMDIKPLLDLTCAKVASLIKGRFVCLFGWLFVCLFVCFVFFFFLRIFFFFVYHWQLFCFCIIVFFCLPLATILFLFAFFFLCVFLVWRIGKTPEQIRKTFNITNDFTPEEEEAVRSENKWAEES